MADIVHQIPWQLSNFGGSGVGGSYNLKDYEFDYALGGIPFLSATRDAWPYTEGMAEIRKQQFDSFAEPGEQSITGWWLRSQSTFTGGAGLLYQDPDNDNQFNYKFADSLGVDPWTAGDLSLLRQVNQKNVATGANLVVKGYVDPAGVDAAFQLDGGVLWKVIEASRSGAAHGATGTVLSMTNTGTRYFVQSVNGIWSGIDNGAGAQYWAPPAAVTPTRGLIEFAKDRLVSVWNNGIYFHPIGTPGAGAVPTTQSYVHTDTNWVWTSITEGPAAIYASGTNGTTSSIFKFVFDIQSTVTLIPTVTATTPTGERINTIFGYIGSFMGIATTKGFRVGEFDSNGDVSYGPLLFNVTGGCMGITGFDRFMWTGSQGQHDGFSGLYRIDLGSSVQEQTTRAVRYAYARDIYADGETGQVQYVTMFGATDRKFFSITADSTQLEDASVKIASGYLKTGRIRFNTEEPKLYKFLSLRTPVPLSGDVQVSVLTQSGGEIPYITYSPAFSPGTGDVGTPQPNGPQNWIALKFTLRRGSDTTKGGVLNGWQVKALPGSIRQRMIQHTFLLLDRETDKGGQRMGTDDYARQRFEDFKTLARAGDVVTFQELADDVSTLVVIDDWKYTQTAPPGPNGQALGGYLSVVLRTVAESV